MNKNNFKTCIAGVEQCSRAGQLQLITSSHVSARGSEWEKEGRKKNERERENDGRKEYGKGEEERKC